MNNLRRLARVCEASYFLLAAVLWLALPFPPEPGLRFTSAAIGMVALTSALVAWRLGRPSVSTWRAALVLASVSLVNHGAALAEGGPEGRGVASLGTVLQGVVFVVSLASHYAARFAMSQARPAD